MHMTGVAAAEYHGSLLMPMNLFMKMFTSEFHWPKEHVNWHIHVLQPTLCMLCVCMRVCCV